MLMLKLNVLARRELTSRPDVDARVECLGQMRIARVKCPNKIKMSGLKVPTSDWSEPQIA